MADGRDKWVKVKATEEERRAWYALADASDLSLSNLIRQQMGAALVKRGPQKKRRNRGRNHDPALVREVAKIGNNLNQIARWANGHKAQAEAEQVIAGLIAVQRQLSFLLPASGAERRPPEAEEPGGDDAD